jgi:autophagy-related protein 17
MNFLMDSIKLPTTLPPVTPTSSSNQPSESRSYTTHPGKQDYHAHHLALLLTSLAQHYDQTSSALKDHESHGHIQPIDPETLEILERDASEVSEVLEEMEDHFREIEHSSDTIRTHTAWVYETYVTIGNFFHQLEAYGKERLPSHLASVRDFEARASVHRRHIQTLKQEMFNLVQYYTNFSTAYAALLVEVKRRTDAHVHTSLLVSEISTKLQSLYDQEVRARQGFMDLHAAFLPQDLWTGITDPPTRAIVTVEQGGTLPPLRDPVQRVGSAAAMERRRSVQVALSGSGGSGESSGRRSMESTGRRSLDSSGRR